MCSVLGFMVGLDQEIGEGERSSGRGERPELL